MNLWVWSRKGKRNYMECLLSFFFFFFFFSLQLTGRTRLTSVTAAAASCCWDTRLRNRPTFWKNWTDWTTRWAHRRRKSRWHKLGAKFGRGWWWGESADGRSDGVGSNRHISKWWCRWTVAQCSHWVIKFACGPKLAYSMLRIVSARRGTLIDSPTR